MITVFPQLTPEIAGGIFGFLDNKGLVLLSGVNKTTYEMFSNLFFENLFKRQHPILARFKFEKLCSFFPDNCWKIACSAFPRGQLRLSQTFISEYSPNIYRYIQSQKTQFEAELKNICGSYYEDPDSPIDQAWKAKERIARLQNELKERQTPLLLEARRWFRLLSNNFPELSRIEIFQTLSIFNKTLQKYTDEEILNPNDEITIAIHDEVFLELKDKFSRDCRNHPLAPIWIVLDNDESIRSRADTMIALRLPDLCTILSSGNKFNSNAIRYISNLVTQVYLFSDQKGFEDGDLEGAEKKYRKLEQKRQGYSGRLQTIKEELAAFSKDGKITLTRTPLPLGPSGEVRFYIEFNDAICRYKDVIQYEFERARQGEIAKMRLPHLEECLCLIQNLIDNPEEISPDTLGNIRWMINACDVEDIGHIWGELYHTCANEVHEDNWSEKHFSKFLGPLLQIVYSTVVNYRFQRNCLGELDRE